MQIPTVYACVRLLAESIAALPLHLYRVTDDNGNKEKARDHPLYKILYRQPNPEMTSFVFWETLMTHLLLWGNAYAQIVRDGKNTVLGLYPLLPENVEVDRDESGELYYIYHAYTDEVPGEQNKDTKDWQAALTTRKPCRSSRTAVMRRALTMYRTFAGSLSSGT